MCGHVVFHHSVCIPLVAKNFFSLFKMGIVHIVMIEFKEEVTTNEVEDVSLHLSIFATGE